jgi:hypothetical protein
MSDVRSEMGDVRSEKRDVSLGMEDAKDAG